MTVQDFEWQGGAKLIDYQVLGEGQERDANLSVKVKLTLVGNRQGQEHRENRVLPGWHQPLGHGLPRHAQTLNERRVGPAPGSEGAGPMSLTSQPFIWE